MPIRWLQCLCDNLRFELIRPTPAQLPWSTLKSLGDRFGHMEGSSSRARRSHTSSLRLTTCATDNRPLTRYVRPVCLASMLYTRGITRSGERPYWIARALVEAELKDVGDQALIRGLATAFPITRPGLFLSYCGRRSCRPQSGERTFPCRCPAPANA